MKTIQVDSTKGIGKWFAKLLNLTGISGRMQADMQIEEAYAAQHGFTYQAISQAMPTGPDGIGSAILSSDGATVFYHHIAGSLGNHTFDTCIWSHLNKTPTASTANNGVSFGLAANLTNNQRVTRIDSVFAGRITIDKNLSSLIVASKVDSLRSADPELFKQFNNAGNVTLEGNFNQYFEVYAPREDPVSAFQSLPPNLMAVLLDEFQGTCLEFVGNSIYLLLLRPQSVSTISIGAPIPSFSASDNDMMATKLQRLASFFDGPLVVAGSPTGTDEVITHTQGINLHF